MSSGIEETDVLYQVTEDGARKIDANPKTITLFRQTGPGEYETMNVPAPGQTTITFNYQELFWNGWMRARVFENIVRWNELKLRLKGQRADADRDAYVERRRAELVAMAASAQAASPPPAQAPVMPAAVDPDYAAFLAFKAAQVQAAPIPAPVADPAPQATAEAVAFESAAFPGQSIGPIIPESAPLPAVRLKKDGTPAKPSGRPKKAGN